MINNLRYIGVLGAVYVACTAAATAQAADPDWLVALTARSEAMNRHYGLGEYGRQGARSASSPEWLVALNARSDALNRKHGLGTHRSGGS
jgi:hypothetical protein